MLLDVQIREIRFPADYAGVLHLWENVETGMRVGRSDSLEEIKKKLQRDPDLFLVAEQKDRIVGTIIGGYDGRRGMVYHLVVQKEFRKNGLATQLLTEVEKRLQAKGCVKCYLLVFADNVAAMNFYENRGWRPMKEDVIFGKEFP